MSTILMQQNTLYDFGDSYIKNSVARSDQHLTVGTNAVRLTLSRMASSPGTQELANLLGSLATHQHRRLERTQSAPAPSVSPSSIVSGASVNSNTSRYKTELCRPFEEFGVCKYGDKCQFAHGIGELRSLARHPKYKTELCRTYHTAGFCPYGPRCHFVHNQEEALMNAKGMVPALSPPLMLSRNSLTSNISRPRPAALSPSLSLDSHSPTCSLSQSPTSSMGSFFSSEPELHSPINEERLPVFNRLSTAQLLQLSELML